MRLRTSCLLSILVAGLAATPAPAQSRLDLSMDLGWRFTPGDPSRASQSGFDDRGWRTVKLPHDWSIEGEFDPNAPAGGNGGYLPTGIGWYRKTFTVPQEWLGRRVTIRFDGVYENSTVWINGQRLGHRPNGYVTFEYDLTPHLRAGENVLAVRVDNSNQPNSRWYSGSGIYRHVWLTVTDRLHIATWGVWVRTPVATAEYGIVEFDVTVENRRGQPADAELVAVLVDSAGVEVGRAVLPVAAGTEGPTTVQGYIHVDRPALWSPDSPALYTLHTELREKGAEIDRTSTTVGIRTIAFDVDRGFLLNGERVKMHGVNLHHDGGAVGAAVPIGVWERRLRELKAMGVNAIRTAHNPVAPEFLELCDRLGFLVMDEIFDEWTRPKRQFAYSVYFDDWWEEDLRATILRDRNHPSVVLWSAGNEIPEQRSGEHGLQVLRNLMRVFHELDPTRPVTTGNDYVGDIVNPPSIAFYDELDIVGYNYVDRWTTRRELYYTPDRIAHPDWLVIGTESVNIAGRRGWYPLGNDPDRIVPGYNTGMIRAAELWKYVATHDFVAGDFMWTGIDYLGEAGWPSKHASAGVLDLAGFRKDSYYFYQSQWTDEPVLHLFPHWNLPEERIGQVLPVIAYTNLSAVELYLNGRFLGEKRVQFPRPGTTCGWNCYDEPPVQITTADLHLSWDVPYEPGVLRAVGKNRAGEVVLTREIVTTGPPVAVRLTVDRPRITANHRDVAHVVVEIVDAEGRVVPTAENLVELRVEGPGVLIGVDNGNPVDHDSHKASSRRAWAGLALGIVQATRDAGTIRVTATSSGLRGDVVEIVTGPDPEVGYYFEDVVGGDADPEDAAR